MSAWISPCFTSRLTPLRISLSSTVTHTFSIFKTLFISFDAQKALSCASMYQARGPRPAVHPPLFLHLDNLRNARIPRVMRNRQLVVELGAEFSSGGRAGNFSKPVR